MINGISMRFAQEKHRRLLVNTYHVARPTKRKRGFRLCTTLVVAAEVTHLKLKILKNKVNDEKQKTKRCVEKSN